MLNNILDAILTNCRIKVIFGGLPAQTARLMAEEMFIGDLDAQKVKVAIYQTKFWPQYRRDKVYTHGTSRSISSGSSHSQSSSSSNAETMGTSFFQPDDWFAGRQISGYEVSRNSARGASKSEGWSESESFAETDCVADVPILIPVPFEELSSIQYYSTEEQLIELTAALKEQFPRHCFIKIQGHKTQPLLVPIVEDIRSFRDSDENLQWYQRWLFERQDALPAAKVDQLIAERESTLLQITARPAESIDAAANAINTGDGEEVRRKPVRREKAGQQIPIWSRTTNGK